MMVMPGAITTTTGLARTLATRAMALDAAYLLTEGCAKLPRVDAAGVLLPDGFGHSSPVASTDIRLFDALCALQTDHAPWSSLGEVVTCADLTTEVGRWPRLAQFAGTYGITAMSAVPVAAFGIAVGTLVLLCRREPAPSADEIDAARCWARIAAAGMLADAIADCLPTAAVGLARHGMCHDQITTWQATGALSARTRTDIPTALGMLRGHARDNAAPLVRSARAVLSWSPDIRDSLARRCGDSRVLLVDSDRFSRVILAETLRAEGYDVSAAGTVSAARDQRANPPPVAVIDQLLAGAAEFGRALTLETGTRVIAMSPRRWRQADPTAVVLLHRPTHPLHVIAAVRDLQPSSDERVPR
jgi:CheY-like chemotaxis protein